MTNGSFHGDLLSDHKTTIVSLTHPIDADFQRKGKREIGETTASVRPPSLVLSPFYFFPSSLLESANIWCVSETVVVL
jgi:hypothetical protein